MNIQINGNTKIKLVQGDCYHYVITLDEKSQALVSRLVLTCHAQNISEDFYYDKDSQTWILELQSEDTINYQVGGSTYDLTAVLKDECVKTLIHNGLFMVLEKTNKVTSW